MTNNDVLRQLRYIFDFSDDEMVSIYKEAEINVERWKVCEWLMGDEEKQLPLSNSDLAYFLDGLINKNRGKRENYSPLAQENLTNNQILQKLKIALQLRDSDILDVFKKVDVELSKHELSAFFRKYSQPQYREMGNQYLRNFLHGLQVTYRPTH